MSPKITLCSLLAVALLAPWSLATAASTRTVAVDTPFGEPQAELGWSEAVISVSRLAVMEEYLTHVAQWRVVARGKTDRTLLRHWGLPETAQAREALLCNPGDRSGCVRLIEFRGVPQVQIRSSAQPWETGGLFSLMTRSRDIDGAFARARSLGYAGFSDPIYFDYKGVRLKNMVLRGPDGMNLAVYQREVPKLEGWSTIRGLSSPFNAMQMVRNREVSRAFWIEVMDYTSLSDAEFLDDQPGENNFALPANLVTSISRRHSILGKGVAGLANGAGTRQVELMQFVGLQGRELSARAVFPNLGLVALRFPIANLAAYRARAAKYGTADCKVSAVKVQGWGQVKACDLRSPDGVIAELLENSSGQ
jgi:hypothetical protein